MLKLHGIRLLGRAGTRLQVHVWKTDIGVKVLPALLTWRFTTTGFSGRSVAFFHSGRCRLSGTALPPSAVKAPDLGRFKYKPLSDPSEIRLLILQPGRGNDPIYCRLLHASLGDDPQYEALSYTWGDPSITMPIWLGGKSFQVTESLQAALFNLRDESFEDPKDRLLWVDAICIYQLNVTERNYQVQLMGRIYGNASRAIIWLGRYHEPGDKALSFNKNIWGFNFLRPGTADAIQKAFNILTKMAKLDEDQKTRGLANSDLPNFIDSISHQDFGNLHRLVMRPWFDRLWVFQELYLAKEARVLCGRLEMDWAKFSQSCHKLTQIWRSGAITSKKKALINDSLIWRSSVLTGTNQRPDYSLIELIHNVSHRQCTQPHDRLYALLGICSDWQDVQVDYNSSCQDIYARWVWANIQRTQGLEIFSACHRRVDTASFVPSWVPKFGEIDDDVVDNSLLSGSTNYDKAYRHMGRLPYRASGSSTTGNAQLSDDRAQLSLSGLAIDFIVSVLDTDKTSFSFNSTDDLYRGMVTSVLEAVACLETKVAHHFSLSELSYGSALWSEFTDVLFRGYTEDFEPLNGRGQVLLDRYVVLRGFAPVPYDYAPHLTLDDQRKSYVRHIEATLIDLTHGIRVVVTANGSLGLVKSEVDVKVGDSLYILFGGNTPFILRRCGANHTLVAPCYLHGFMDGEALARLRNGKYKNEVVRLV